MKNKLRTTYLKYPIFEDVNMLDEHVEEYKKRFPNYYAVPRENYKENLKCMENILIIQYIQSIEIKTIERCMSFTYKKMSRIWSRKSYNNLL